MDVIGAKVFQIDGIAHWGGLGPFGFRDRHRLVIRGLEFFLRGIHHIGFYVDDLSLATFNGTSEVFFLRGPRSCPLEWCRSCE